MRVVVTGAGLAGLSAAISAGRAGHHVLVCERDGSTPPSPSLAFDEWERSGIGQFRQPHNFLALARNTLRTQAPEVLETLLSIGATEIDQSALLPADVRRPEDEELAAIACRRPVFEAVLRDLAVATSNVEIRSGVVVDGLVLEHPGSDVVCRGVTTADGATVDADLVVDAAGRTSRVRSWLEAAGARLPERREQACGVVYFSRHYRLRPDAVAPGGPYILGGPRGDLRFLTFAVFVGDNRTFCVVMTTAPADEDFKGLRTPDGYQAVASRIPVLADWVHPDRSEPITPSVFMGHLTNMIQFVHGESCVRGIRPIGDALSHTNPTFAFGASLSLLQGFSLGPLMADHPDTLDMSEAFEARHHEDLVSRFEAVSAEDVDRQRWWGGEALEPTDPTQSMALAIRFALYPAAARDAELFRAVARRIGALDPIDALPNRTDLVQRGLAIRRQMMTESTPPANPTREELAAAVKAAT